MSIKKTGGFILGVDAGSTKVEIAVADTTGKVIGRACGGPSGFNSQTAEEICQNIAAALLTVIRRARLPKDLRFTAAVFGISGVDCPEDEKVMRAAIRKYFRPMIPLRFMIVNDVVIALQSALKQSAGIALIAGTGSNCYGIDGRGGEAFAGGLGHSISDEGSAYDIGIRALRAGVKSHDGRGPRSMLEPMLRAFFGVRTFRDITHVLYHTRLTKFEIARIAPLVEATARKGDRVARATLDETVSELMLMLGTVARRLRLHKKPCDVVLVGGVFHNNKYVYNTFIRAVKRLMPQAHIVRPRLRPVIGAIQLALKEVR